jgi:hypothetical protein
MTYLIESELCIREIKSVLRWNFIADGTVNRCMSPHSAILGKQRKHRIGEHVQNLLESWPRSSYLCFNDARIEAHTCNSAVFEAPRELGCEQ